MQRNESGAAALVFSRVLLREALPYDIHLSLSLIKPYALPQAPDHSEIQASTIESLFVV